MAEPELIHLEKTRPIQVLESRRLALIGWLKAGQDAIKEADEAIRKHKAEAIEMTDEIAEIERALNVLNEAAKPQESSDDSRE
jgi:hypothetical protein